MFKQLLHRFILLVFLWVPLGASADDEFGSVIILGDSLSDNGNLAAFSLVIPEFADFQFLNNPALPYDAGFSNGPRAVEVLAEELGLPAEPSLHLISPTGPLGTNFSIAGARATDAFGFNPINLPTQLQFYLLFQPNMMVPEDALVVVFIGGNDIRDARGPDLLGMLPNDPAAAAFIAHAAAGVETALQTLADAGARTILLANAPDIGAIPETRLLAPFFGGKHFIKRATKLTRSYNKQISQAARRTERDFDVDIIEFDTFRFFNQIQRKAKKLGFTNVSDACFSTSALSMGQVVFHPDCNSGFNFDSFVFFDEIHPTAEVHRLAGEAIAEELDDFDDDDDDD